MYVSVCDLHTLLLRKVNGFIGMQHPWSDETSSASLHHFDKQFIHVQCTRRIND